jgi:hypothetical protein
LPRSSQLFIGPAALGAVSFSLYGKIKYEVGYMFGMTPATPVSTIPSEVTM